jgi:hypothetical protein
MWNVRRRKGMRVSVRNTEGNRLLETIEMGGHGLEAC